MHVDPSTYDVDPGKPWLIFAGVMLGIVGLLNLIYGIAMIGNSTFFHEETKFVLANLNFWGWVLACLGAGQSSPSWASTWRRSGGAGSASPSPAST